MNEQLEMLWTRLMYITCGEVVYCGQYSIEHVWDVFPSLLDEVQP